jgi:hypothetical protein
MGMRMGMGGSLRRVFAIWGRWSEEVIEKGHQVALNGKWSLSMQGV